MDLSLKLYKLIIFFKFSKTFSNKLQFSKPLARQKRVYSFLLNVPFSVIDGYTRLKLDLQKPGTDVYTRQ